MRARLLTGSLLLLAACAKPDQQAAKDTTSASMGAGAPAETISLSALAGTWSMKTTKAGTDSVVVTFDLVATADGTGWTINFPDHPPVPATSVVADGDSVIMDAGPYESVLRKGVQVTVHSVMRLENGELVGPSTATYQNAGADSVVDLYVRGTRQ